MSKLLVRNIPPDRVDSTFFRKGSRTGARKPHLSFNIAGWRRRPALSDFEDVCRAFVFWKVAVAFANRHGRKVDLLKIRLALWRVPSHADPELRPRCNCKTIRGFQWAESIQ